jgi:multidrug efflux pump subunit AcrB
VISVVWQYTGLPPDQMAGRITTPFQRALTTTVNDIEHIEANSYNGIGIVKIFFQPGVDIAPPTPRSPRSRRPLLKQMPPGITPPLILNYNASTVPIIQLALSGRGLSEQASPTSASTRCARRWSPCRARRSLSVRRQAAPGADRPRSRGDAGARPVGPGRRQRARRAEPDHAGRHAEDRRFEYTCSSTTRRRDRGARRPADQDRQRRHGLHPRRRQVRDGNPPQTNIVHVDGNRSVLMQVLKNGSTSTLAIIDGIKQKLEEIKAALPDALKIALHRRPVAVRRGAISGVARRGVIAAALTSLMILLFLGSWRST